MGAKNQAFDIFQTPLSSHYPLPLITCTIKCTCYKRLSEDAARLYADGVMLKSVLRIRIRDPVPFWPLDPGFGAFFTPGSGIQDG